MHKQWMIERVNSFKGSIEGQHVSLRAGVWDDAAAWGILLADLARHVANCYEETEVMDGLSALKRIKEGFDAEFASPTDDPTGEILT